MYFLIINFLTIIHTSEFLLNLVIDQDLVLLYIIIYIYIVNTIICMYTTHMQLYIVMLVMFTGHIMFYTLLEISVDIQIVYVKKHI